MRLNVTASSLTMAFLGRHDILDNDTQHSDILHNDTQHKDIQDNDALHKELLVTLSINYIQYK